MGWRGGWVFDFTGGINIIKEFSQKISFFANLMFFVWTTWSYILASLGLDPNVEVTKIIAGQCISVNIGYYSYQGWLKNSSNKYGTDKNGVPYRLTNEEDK